MRTAAPAVLSLCQMRQELVHTILQSREMQEVRLIENQPDESDAFVRCQCTTQLHLFLHDQEDQQSIESAVQNVQQSLLLNLERQRPHLVIHWLAAMVFVAVIDVLQELAVMFGCEHQHAGLHNRSSIARQTPCGMPVGGIKITRPPLRKAW